MPYLFHKKANETLNTDCVLAIKVFFLFNAEEIWHQIQVPSLVGHDFNMFFWSERNVDGIKQFSKLFGNNSFISLFCFVLKR